MDTQIEKITFISWRFIKRIVLILVIILVFDFIFFNAPVFASETDNYPDSENYLAESIDPALFINGLPANSELKVKSTGYFHVTAYNSEVSQCDGAPCLTANGFNLCEYGIEDSIAANFLPFGAKLKIPELFGDKVFVVRDRMNARYSNYIDIWMKDKIAAVNFGVKIAKIEILEH